MYLDLSLVKTRVNVEDGDPGTHVALTDGLPFVKAATRDINALLNASNYRDIPVGFVGQNYTLSNELCATYLNCGNVSESIDFWALNTNWCGTETQSFVSTYESYGVPVLFGLYDCNSSTSFSEVGALYAPRMTEVFSGGFLYSWHGM
jgi:hypothetical protein